MTKKYTLLGILLASILLTMPNVSFGATNAEIQVQIQAIMAQIQTLQQQLVQLQASDGGATTAWCHTFNTDLKIGDVGDEVNALQIALQKEGFSISNNETAKSGGTPMVAYSVPANFGESTASAVTGFQEKYRDEILTPLGLKYGTGYVGKSTRAKLNQLYGCGGVTKPPVSAGYLEIEPSSASIAVGGSVSMQAMYQPPMPKCPEGFECLQVMPARYPVAVNWTSSNPSIATAWAKPKGCPYPSVTTCADYRIGVVSGVSAGIAEIKAAYRESSGIDITATAKVTVGSGSTASSITILSPNGGETWTKGTTQTIKWRNNTPISICPVGVNCDPPVPQSYDIKLVPDYPQRLPCTASPCPTYAVRVPYTIANGVYDSSYNWHVGDYLGAAWLNSYPGNSTVVPDGLYTVQVCQSGTDICDSSDSYFKIASVGTSWGPTISSVSGPSTLQTGQQSTWTVNASDPNNGTLSYSVVWGDETYYRYGASVPSTQPVQQTAIFNHTYNTAGTYYPKFTVTNNAGGSSQTSLSVVVGGITQPSITVLSPNGGEVWQVGQTYDIKWNQTRAGTVTIGLRNKQLSGSGGSGGLWYIIGEFSGSAGVNTYKWTLSSGLTYSGGYEVQIDGSIISEAGRPILGSDTSNAPFSISGTPAGTADASSGDDSSLAVVIAGMKETLNQMQQILNNMAR